MRLAALLLFVALPLQAQAPADKAATEREVMAVFQDFLAAMKTKDSLRLASHIDSTTRFTLLRPSPQGTRVVALSGTDFLAAVTRPDAPGLDEPVRNPVIQVDGNLATIWAEYQVIINGAVSHCGYDAVHLARLAGGWKIINVSDSFRREGCGGPWK